MAKKKGAAVKRKPAICAAASVMWSELPAHIGGAYSKLLVRPESCGAKSRRASGAKRGSSARPAGRASDSGTGERKSTATSLRPDARRSCASEGAGTGRTCVRSIQNHRIA